jgi:hypothetical protein
MTISDSTWRLKRNVSITTIEKVDRQKDAISSPSVLQLALEELFGLDHRIRACGEVGLQ